MDARAPARTKSVPDCVLKPQIRLSGLIDDDKFLDFQSQLDDAIAGEGQIGLELTTNGGNADLARRIAMDIQIASEKLGRELFFIGKTTVYSAGVTIMAAFPRERRFLTRDCILLIHERRLDKSVQLTGALEGNLARIKEVEHEIRTGMDIEKEGFAMLIDGSDVGMDELYEKACENWYVRADEALERRLIAGILYSMIPKSGNRFSDKIMLKQEVRAPFRFHRNGSGSSQPQRAAAPERARRLLRPLRLVSH